MKKSIKLVSIIGLLLSILSICFMFTGCGHHQHTPANTWSGDEYSHWRECRDENCHIKINKTTHLWGGTQTIQRESFSHEGIYKHTCKVCYASKIVTKPKLALKGESNIYDITNLTQEYSGKPINEPKYKTVGDGEITIEWWQGETLLSGAPSAIGDYKIVIKINETEDYKPFQTSQEFSITKKQIKISKLELPYANSHIFDLNQIDTKFGIAENEKVDLKLSFSSPNVGATLENAEISGENAENYALLKENIKAEIVKAVPQIDFANGIQKNFFNITYGESYVNILAENEKGERENGFDGKTGTHFNISPYVKTADISVQYFTESGQYLSIAPLGYGNYYFEIQIKNNPNYISQKFKVIYYVDKLDLNISDITANLEYDTTLASQTYATQKFKLTELNGIVYSDTVYLNITYAGTKIGDKVIECDFATQNTSNAYVNYRLNGCVNGEIVGKIKINYNQCGTYAYVKYHSNALYSNIDCNEVLTLNHLSMILPPDSEINKIIFNDLNQNEIEFISVSGDKTLLLNTNLNSGGVGADGITYTDPNGRWIAGSHMASSTINEINLNIVLSENIE